MRWPYTYPVEVGDGWCISFHLAINDYDLDCATRLQCLLQGLCPNVAEQLALARKRVRLNPEEAKRFQMSLACPSATRHPRPILLSNAIFLVAVCARRSHKKRQRGRSEYESLTPMQPNKFRRKTERTKLWPRRHLSLLVLQICVMMRHNRAGVSRGRVRRLSTPPKPCRSILVHKRTRYLWEKNHREGLHCLDRGRRQVKPLRWIIEMKVH